MTRALRIAIVGAESTGKSTLASALADRLGRELPLRVAHVPELLRDWCEERGRTPMESEQRGIALAQQERIDDAAQGADIVVCDTTPLMIAVYSRIVFGDDSLDAYARVAHATNTHTLLTALDLPWLADGLMRDGPHVRAPVDRAIREHLVASRCDWSVVYGTGDTRMQHALDALRPVLTAWNCEHGVQRTLFSSLLFGDAGPRRLGADACAECEKVVSAALDRRRA